MNRIEKLFKEKSNGILSVFFTAGFPALKSTGLIVGALEKAGVDLIEIGIPFSDPIADGPTIQDSNKVALRNGMSVKVLLEQIQKIRKEVSIPIILMGYLNPVLQYGFEKFCTEAASNGVDGLILPDMPLEEFEQDYRTITEKNGLINIFMVSPTTSDERIRKIDSISRGFIYAISSSSTTGARSEFSNDQAKYFIRLKDLGLKNPFLVGFGISNHQTFSKASEYSSGAIVGSAFINLLKEAKDINQEIEQFIEQIRPGSISQKKSSNYDHTVKIND